MTVSVISINAQNDKQGVMDACKGYFAAFYDGDLEAVDKYFSRTLYKVGYWKNDDGSYSDPLIMTFEDVKNYAQRVLDEEDFAADDATQVIDILQVEEKIAVAKVTGTWGFDYINLRKDDKTWKVEQVIWQGPN